MTMRIYMHLIKVFIINLTIMFALLFVLVLSPPILHFVYSLAVRTVEAEVFSDVNFSSTENLQVEYYDYISWRRSDARLDGITIVDGERITSEHNSLSFGSETWFFGGSTTWGFGVLDNQTYPFYFSEMGQKNTRNFGESGYIARQSLAFLNNLTIENKTKNQDVNTIVFYDGINDVNFRCRKEVEGLSTARQAQLRERLRKAKSSNSEIFSFAKTFEQLIALVLKLKTKFLVSEEELGDTFAREQYSCSENHEKAHYVAKTLVNTWYQASIIAASKDSDFAAILQPVSFFGTSQVKGLKLDNPNNIALRKQYEAVYPLIKTYAKDREFKFIDATSVFAECNDCYFDFMHVGAKGNKILAEFLSLRL